MPTLLWFRRDLRLNDLPALLDAARDDREVLACYVLDPRLKATSGPRRLQYLYDSLRELRDSLDGRLLITQGRAEARIPALVKKIQATSVHVSGDYFPFGLRRDEAVRKALGLISDGVPLEDSGSPYLVSPGRVTKGDGTPYKVFTPYFSAWREHGWRDPARGEPGTCLPMNWGRSHRAAPAHVLRSAPSGTSGPPRVAAGLSLAAGSRGLAAGAPRGNAPDRRLPGSRSTPRPWPPDCSEPRPPDQGPTRAPTDTDFSTSETASTHSPDPPTLLRSAVIPVGAVLDVLPPVAGG